MKKLAPYLMALSLSLTFIPVSSNANVIAPSTVVVSKTEAKAHADALILRLKEIKAMDKSNLQSSEKRQLRKEVRAINQELRHSNGGIYLSIGAVVIIILLLIILL